jgi:hypothetical protein
MKKGYNAAKVSMTRGLYARIMPKNNEYYGIDIAKEGMAWELQRARVRYGGWHAACLPKLNRNCK